MLFRSHPRDGSAAGLLDDDVRRMAWRRRGVRRQETRHHRKRPGAADGGVDVARSGVVRVRTLASRRLAVAGPGAGGGVRTRRQIVIETYRERVWQYELIRVSVIH